MPLQETVDSLKGSILSLGVDGVVAFAEADAPWLRLPIISPVFKFIVKNIISVAIDKTELGLFIVYTVQQKDAQAKEYEKAALAYDAAPKGIPNVEREKLLRAKIDAARKLIKFTPKL